jgi:mRNA-degrading endonuclease toxin of MazEF toxin-antitoxin module
MTNHLQNSQLLTEMLIEKIGEISESEMEKVKEALRKVLEIM